MHFQGARRHLCHRQRLRLGRYSGSRGSPSPSASSTTPPRLILRLEGLAVTFGIINYSASADTPARGARRHLRLHLRRLSRRYFGLRGSPGSSASPPTSPSPLLRLEGFAGTFGFTFDISLTATSAQRARPLIITFNGSRCMTTASPSTTTTTTSTFMSSTSTNSTTCKAYLMSTNQEGLEVYRRTGPS
jgi:hypothetical protein